MLVIPIGYISNSVVEGITSASGPCTMTSSRKSHTEGACRSTRSSPKTRPSAFRGRCTPSVVSAEDDLECPGLACAGEHVVGLHELVEAEAVGDKALRVDLVAGEQTQQGRRRVRVDQPGRDRHVFGPQPLQVQRGRLAVHADVCLLYTSDA